MGRWYLNKDWNKVSEQTIWRSGDRVFQIDSLACVKPGGTSMSVVPKAE